MAETSRPCEQMPADVRGEAFAVDFTPVPPAPEPEAANPYYPARMGLYAVVIVTAAAMAWSVVVRTEGKGLPAAASASSYLPPPNQPLSESELTVQRTLETRVYEPAEAAAGDAMAQRPQQEDNASDDAAGPLAQHAKRPPRGFHPSAFRLSAIINGPDGPTAIINGKFVQVGARVQHAQVVGITDDGVQLRVEDKTYTLRL